MKKGKWKRLNKIVCTCVIVVDARSSVTHPAKDLYSVVKKLCAAAKQLADIKAPISSFGFTTFVALNKLVYFQ